jgi:hypothetical protein
LPYVPIDGGSFLDAADSNASADGDGADAGDDGPQAGDAIADAEIASDAASDALSDGPAFDASADGGGLVVPPRTKQCDDLDVAVRGLHPTDVWVTRMRAFLPNAAMDTTLELEPMPQQTIVENVHYAASLGTIPAGLHVPGSDKGTFATLFAVLAILWSRLGRKRGSRG